METKKLIIVLILVVVVLAGIGVLVYLYLRKRKSDPGPGSSCKVNGDCPSGQYCNNGTCTSDKSCKNNSECGDGKICENKVCVVGDCNTEKPCPEDQNCVDRKCHVKVICKEDSDCKGNPQTPHCETVEGVCVQCVNDNHCSKDKQCLNKICVEKDKTFPNRKVFRDGAWGITGITGKDPAATFTGEFTTNNKTVGMIFEPKQAIKITEFRSFVIPRSDEILEFQLWAGGADDTLIAKAESQKGENFALLVSPQVLKEGEKYIISRNYYGTKTASVKEERCFKFVEIGPEQEDLKDYSDDQIKFVGVTAGPLNRKPTKPSRNDPLLNFVYSY
jgi:hypothetical protein